MELVRMYQNKLDLWHHEGCLLHTNWGIVLMVTFDLDMDEESLNITATDTKWYINHFNDRYYHM